MRKVAETRQPAKRLRAAVVAVAGGGVLLAAAVTALGGHEPGSTPSYTGCLNTSSGTLTKLAPGDAPDSPCTESQLTVHLGGGDLTGLSAGFGLIGGGDEGNVTVAVDPATVQRRVVTDCAPSGGAITAIHEDGTAACSPADERGLVATLDAGVVSVSGLADASLCDEGFNEDGSAGGPATATAGPVQLDGGIYQIVPRSFRWQITKTLDHDDADVFYGGLVYATLGSQGFVREQNTRGLIPESNRDWGLLEIGPGGESVSLTISAYAWDCSSARIGGAVGIVRLG